MKNLFKSLANFQQEVPAIHKGTKGYGYSYASLPTIFDVINPVMKKNGLGFTQGVDGNTLVTTVFHIDSGESITQSAEIPTDVKLKGMNEFQVLGSAITYMRRYQLSAMLGIVTDVDNDAAGEQVTKKEEEPKWLNEGTEDWNKLLDWAKSKGVAYVEALETAKKAGFAVSKSTQQKLEKILAQ